MVNAVFVLFGTMFVGIILLSREALPAKVEPAKNPRAMPMSPREERMRYLN